MKIITKYFHEIKKLEFFLFISLLYVLFSVLLNEFIIKDDLYYQTLGEQLARERIEQLLEFKHKWDWIAYLIIPVILFFKFLFVALCLETGSILQGYKTSFKQMFHIAMFSELVFLFAQMLKTVVIALAKLEDLNELQYIASFSLLSIINNKNIDPWFIYPLHTINIFEILYWLFLAFILKTLLQKEYTRMIKFVLSTYGVGLLILLIVVMFINVNFS
ncbi:hypothetical protein ES708_27008 [subsurface metagenome]